MRIRFVSSNERKIEETTALLRDHGISVLPVRRSIPELQVKSLGQIVKDKCIKAFQAVGHPLIVEHTALEVEALNGFPGGMTQLFWETLGVDVFGRLIAGAADPKARATSMVGYCDGRRVHLFEGALSGKVTVVPRGEQDFHWDCVFVPDGFTETFAELGERKHAISMRRTALDKFCGHVGDGRVEGVGYDC